MIMTLDYLFLLLAASFMNSDFSLIMTSMCFVSIPVFMFLFDLYLSHSV